MIACCVPIIGTALVYGLPRNNLAGQMVGLYFVSHHAVIAGDEC